MADPRLSDEVLAAWAEWQAAALATPSWIPNQNPMVGRVPDLLHDLRLERAKSAALEEQVLRLRLQETAARILGGLRERSIAQPDAGVPWAEWMEQQAVLRRRPTIEAHIRAVKEAYKQGVIDCDTKAWPTSSLEDGWTASESRALLAQCWLDAVEAMDRQDAEPAPIVRTHYLRHGAPVCGADPGEPSAHVLDSEATCLACLEVIDRAFEAAGIPLGSDLEVSNVPLRE